MSNTPDLNCEAVFDVLLDRRQKLDEVRRDINEMIQKYVLSHKK